jgi:hypothetical protein
MFIGIVFLYFCGDVDKGNNSRQLTQGFLAGLLFDTEDGSDIFLLDDS